MREKFQFFDGTNIFEEAIISATNIYLETSFCFKRLINVVDLEKKLHFIIQINNI